jgi:hypothetical protein
MRDGKLRNSAFANRTALHSDYYSTTQKTATPLNEWWTISRRRREPPAPHSTPGARRRTTIASMIERARCMTSSARKPLGTGVSQHRCRASPRRPRTREVLARMPRQARRTISAGSNPAKKILQIRSQDRVPPRIRCAVGRIGDGDSLASVAMRTSLHHPTCRARAVGDRANRPFRCRDCAAIIAQKLRPLLRSPACA